MDSVQLRINFCISIGAGESTVGYTNSNLTLPKLTKPKLITSSIARLAFYFQITN